MNKNINFELNIPGIMPFVEVLRLKSSTADISIVIIACSILQQIDFRAGLLLLSSVMIHSGGDIINDIYDRRIDRICKPNSPIVSGRMSVTTAWAFVSILYSVSIVIAASLNYICVILSILGIFIGGILYSHPKFRLKDHPILSITGLAVCFALVPAAVWSIYAPVTIDTLMVSLYAFMLIFSLAFFKDFKDVKGDINSLPLMLGVKKAAIVVSALSLFPLLPMLYLLWLYKTTAIALAIIIYLPIAISAVHILTNDPVTNGHTLKDRMLMMIFIPSLVIFSTTFFL